MNAWELNGLVKTFDDRTAVDHLDLIVPAGSFYGLVGPNGAGKTTSILMGTGLIRPDAGTSTVFGADVWREPLRAKSLIGLLPDGLALPERLTGPEVLTYLGLLRGLDADEVETRTRELLSVLDLDRTGRTLVADFSTGMRKKIGLAAALLHGPRLLVLDEPFEAIDPVSASVIRGILQNFVAGGGSVVFSSHVMVLVEHLCTHVAVINEGRIAAAGTLAEVGAGQGLEERFVELVGVRTAGAELSWLSSS